MASANVSHWSHVGASLPSAAGACATARAADRGRAAPPPPLRPRRSVPAVAGREPPLAVARVGVIVLVRAVGLLRVTGAFRLRDDFDAIRASPPGLQIAAGSRSIVRRFAGFAKPFYVVSPEVIADPVRAGTAGPGPCWCTRWPAGRWSACRWRP